MVSRTVSKAVLGALGVATVAASMIVGDMYGNSSVGVWSLVPSNLPLGPNWNTVTATSTGQYQVVAAPFEAIYYSSDYGVTWEQSMSPNNLSWVALASNSDGTYMYALEITTERHLEGVDEIHISTDKGKTWSAEPVNEANNDMWTAVATDCSGRVVGVLGNRSHGIHLSYNYGLNFLGNEYTYPDIWFNDIAISCDGSFMIAVAQPAIGTQAGSAGIYVNKGTGFPAMGQQVSDVTANNEWTSCAVNTDGTVMYAVDPSVKGGVYKSVDQFATWTKTMSTTPLSSLIFSAVSCDLSGQQVLASYWSNSKSYTYYSSDGGATWIDTGFRADSLQVAASLAPAMTLQMSGSSWFGLIAGLQSDSTVKDVFRYSKCPYGQSIQYSSGAVNGTYTCVSCPSGTYMVDYDVVPMTAACLECPIDTYATSDGSMATCTACPYPTGTANTGSSDCIVIWLDLSLAIQFSLYGVGILWFLYVMITGNQTTYAAFVVLLFPLLDIFTDFAYIATSRFYNAILFALCVIMFFHPAPIFLYKLKKYGSVVPSSAKNLYWIGYASTATSAELSVVEAGEIVGDIIPYPTIFGHRFELIFSFQHHSNLWILLWECFTWFVAVFLQLLTFLVGPFFYLLWLLIGVFLQGSKTIAISSVWNMWFFVWRGDHDIDDIGGGFVDTEELNYGMLAQFLCETIPHIILQSVNNTLLDAWKTDAIAITSFVFSILMAVNSLYHYFYHKAMAARVRSMKDVPIDRSINLAFCGLGCLLFNGKLDAYSKVIRGFESSDLDNKSLLDPVGNNMTAQKDADNNLNVTQQGNHASLSNGGNSTVGLPQATPAGPPMAVATNRGSRNKPSAGGRINESSNGGSITSTGKSGTKGSNVVVASPVLSVSTVAVASEPYRPPGDGESNSNNSTVTVPIPLPTSAPYVPPRAPPPQLVCPLSHRLMHDPVIAEDGYTYDRAAILHYVQQYQCSPITHAPISSGVMTNRTIAELLSKFNTTGST
jgi:hypothetical protein